MIKKKVMQIENKPDVCFNTPFPIITPGDSHVLPGVRNLTCSHYRHVFTLRSIMEVSRINTGAFVIKLSSI